MIREADVDGDGQIHYEEKDVAKTIDNLEHAAGTIKERRSVMNQRKKAGTITEVIDWMVEARFSPALMRLSSPR